MYLRTLLSSLQLLGPAGLAPIEGALPVHNAIVPSFPKVGEFTPKPWPS